MKAIQLISLFLLVCFTNSLIAQEPVSIHLTEKDGLPDVQFYSMIEDNDGFIWFATNTGLYRYDGKEFRAFTHSNIKGRSVFNLKLDSKGRVWCNNIAGQFFYVENKHLVLFKDFKNKFGGRLVNYDFFNNQLIILDFIDMFSIDMLTYKETKPITDFSLKFHSFLSKKRTLTYIDKKENIIFIDKNNCKTIYTIKSKGKNIRQLFKDTKRNRVLILKFHPGKDKVFIIVQDRVSLESLVFVQQKSSKEFVLVSLPKKIADSRIEHIKVIDNEFYLLTDKGLFVTSFTNNALKITNHFFKKEFITDILTDANGAIWVTTLRNGLYILPNKNMKVYNNQSNVKILEKKNDSTCFVAKRNGDLATLNVNTNTSKNVFREDNKEIRALCYNEATNKLFYTSDLLTFIYDDKTKERFYIRNDPATKYVSYYKDSMYLISMSSVTSIIRKGASKKIISKVRSYKSIYSQKNKQIYVTDVEGVKVVDSNLNEQHKILHNNKAIQAFDIVETVDGNIWLATFDKGILKVSNNKVIQQFNSSNGLISNHIIKIIADGNALWIVTNKGLQYYNGYTLENNVLTMQDGIKSFRISGLQVLGNKIIYANEFGVYGFDKTKIFKTEQPPNVYINKVFVEEKQVETTDKYVLEHDENNIEINFNVKKFQSIQYTDYQYKLSNKEVWKTVNHGVDFVKFSRLPVGEYQFQLRAKNKFKNKYSKVIKINITVLAPFYQTYWFYSIIILFLLGIILFIIQKVHKEHQLKIRHLKAEKQISILRLENLQSQMNPHFIFNAINSVLSLIATDQKDDACNYLTKLSRLIRGSINHTNKTWHSLEEEINQLNTYLELEKLRFSDDFICEIGKASGELKNLQIPTMIIQPFVENSIKHGLLHQFGEKKLSITYKKEQQSLKVIIEDNGVGREASFKINSSRPNYHVSFAVNSIQKRFSLYRTSLDLNASFKYEDLYDDEKKAVGTRVTLFIPYKK